MYQPQFSSNSLKGHLTITVDTKGLINGSAKAVLKEEPYHTDLITQKITGGLQNPALLSSLHIRMKQH